MLSNFKCIKRPLLFSSLTNFHLHYQPIKLKFPTKTLKNLPNFIPKSKLSMSSSSSWSCSTCTFLNPPSQILTCQICQTPNSSISPLTTTSSKTPPKWNCKACTFLNSYSRSNCEICNTRAPSSSVDIIDDDFENPSSTSSDVGSVFFPLRKCDSLGKAGGANSDGDKIDLGIKDLAKIEMGSGEFDKKVVDFGGSSDNLRSNKRKFQEPTSGSADPVNCFSALKKEDFGEEYEKIVDDSERSFFLKKAVEKAVESDGFRIVKSSKRPSSVLDEKAGKFEQGEGSASVETAENGKVKKVLGTVKILTYNVWFREELEGQARMEAIGDLIQLHSPDVICFQEVTFEIYKMFQRSIWWKKYQCSVPFERAISEGYFCMQLAKLPVKSFSHEMYSITGMGRELCVAEIKISEKQSVVVATTHLESPSPGPPKWDQYFSKERVSQAKEAISSLTRHPNVVFCGDMNWEDKRDGRFPYTEGWFDAWEKLRPAEVGWTYDTKSNKMLTAYRTLRLRLDRFICKLPDFEVTSIEMIGTEAIPGLEHTTTRKVKGKLQELTLPVFPSDHFGLLLTISY